MITVAPGALFEAVTDKFAHSATVAVRIRDNAGADFYPRSATGVTEDVTVGSDAVFRVLLTAPTSAGQYTVVWDNGTILASEELVVTRDASVVYTPTGTEYVTRDQLKATLNITYDDADADVDDAVFAASRVIDEALSRRFYLTTGETRYFDGAPHESRCIIGDWNAVTSIALDTAADGSFATTLVEGTDYDLLDYNANADAQPYTSFRLRRRSFPNSRRNVQIVGDYGWATIPSGVIAYTTILAVQIFQRARQAPFGILVAGIEVGTSARLARVDPDFQRLVGYLDKSQQLA